MRNLEAEKQFLEKTYLTVGVLFFFGILITAIGSELWLIFSYPSLGLPVFLMCQGLWFICVSLFLGFVAAVVARELKHT